MPFLILMVAAAACVAVTVADQRAVARCDAAGGVMVRSKCYVVAGVPGARLELAP